MGHRRPSEEDPAWARRDSDTTLARLPFRREQTDTRDSVFLSAPSSPVSSVCLVTDEIDQRDQTNEGALGQSERLSHVLD